MQSETKYRLSFTAASLMVPEMTRLARCVVLESIPLDQIAPEILGRERSETGKRELKELRLRLLQLTDEELALLAESTIEDQKHLSILAFARTYPFFREFLTEVIMDKIAVFDFHLTDRDYNAYVNRKSLQHQELANITDSTRTKIRQVTFKVLLQAGIIDNLTEKNIQMLHASEKLISIVSRKNPKDIKLFLTF